MVRAFIFGLAFLFSISPSNAQRRVEACNNAISQYNSALSDVSHTLRRYARCVSNSQGSDDCSIEFRRLRSAHSDFESAVSQYGSECN